MLIASYLTEIRVVRTVTLKIVKVLIYRQLRSTYLFLFDVAWKNYYISKLKC